MQSSWKPFSNLHKKLNLSAPDQLVLLSADGLLQIAAEQALGNSPTVLLIDSRGKLETHLVALSQQIKESYAQQIVLAAHNFLLEKFVNVGELGRLLLERFKTELGSRPPEGGFIYMYWLVPGETALLEKRDFSMEIRNDSISCRRSGTDDLWNSIVPREAIRGALYDKPYQWNNGWPRRCWFWGWQRQRQHHQHTACH